MRLKAEFVACGVVYAAARRVHVPLPENPPWWEAFEVEKSGIDEVCRVLAHLYSLPKAEYLHVCKEDGSFTTMSLVTIVTHESKATEIGKMKKERLSKEREKIKEKEKGKGKGKGKT